VPDTPSLSPAVRSFLASWKETELLMSRSKLALAGERPPSFARDYARPFFKSAAQTRKLAAELGFANFPLTTDLKADASVEAIRNRMQVLEFLSRPIDDLAKTGSIDNFFSDLEKLKETLKPTARFAAIGILWPVLLNVAGNLATGPISRFLSPTPTERAAPGTHPETPRIEPLDFRFAMSEGVRIRKAPSTKGEIISKLHKGQLVRVAKSENGWALIDLKGEDTEVVGWTYDRLLGKFTTG
jgi:hypothetical protein